MRLRAKPRAKKRVVCEDDDPSAFRDRSVFLCSARPLMGLRGWGLAMTLLGGAQRCSADFFLDHGLNWNQIDWQPEAAMYMLLLLFDGPISIGTIALSFKPPSAAEARATNNSNGVLGSARWRVSISKTVVHGSPARPTLAKSRRSTRSHESAHDGCSYWAAVNSHDPVWSNWEKHSEWQ